MPLFEFNLVLQDDTEVMSDAVVVLQFQTTIADPVEAVAAARRAVANYLKTDAGRRVVEQNHGVFDWGDAGEIPDIFFMTEGLNPVLNRPTFSMKVDYNENLA